ncbi:F-box protein At5g03100-like [Rhodamnia argentea]|uniref:F-box protein At5g03100-like n=1 Tax=Rhodamnia argentea TaxID=178133 RepID=A0ABM3H4C7_9MYRT|nr:F-box protein At5g03100-like [Rhodamnia argentea]
MAETSVHGAIHRECSAPPPSRRDLISGLPDTMIHNIFSFLPIHDVVKTCVLSKRWRPTWTTATDLVFVGYDVYFEPPPDSPLFFPSIVDSVLSQFSSPTVKKFHLTHFMYDEADRPKIDLWLRFAVRRSVEDLRLRLSEWSRFFYVLPEFLYCFSRLVRLDVGKCCFSLDMTIRWPCLKVLSIEDAQLSDDFLGRIFRGCPVLESLVLSRCEGVNNIIIDSLCLKKLVLVSLGFGSYVKKLCAPHLLSLRVIGGNHAGFRLDNVSSLVEADLDFSVESRDPNSKGCHLLRHLLEKLRGVPTITTGGWCLQVLSLLEMDGVPSPLSKCQNLILHAPVNQWDLPGIAYMLRSSQCLEKLVIYLTCFPMFELHRESEERFNFDEEDFLCSRKGNFECLVKHLKRVEIVGFEAYVGESKHLFALIKFLLGDALVLEKLIIKAKLPPTPDGQKQLQVIQNVLSYQRASKNAEIVLDYHFK